MSDDRFKQARRSLIEHNQRQQQDDWDDGLDEDDFGDAPTAMINLDEVPSFAPPPNFAADSGSFDNGGQQAPQQWEPQQQQQHHHQQPAPDPNMGGGGIQMRSHSGVQPNYDNFGGPAGFEQHEAPPQFQASPSQFEPATAPHGAVDAHHPPQQQQQQVYSPPATEPGASVVDVNQSLVIGGGAASDFEENTAFINLNDFAAGGETFTPDATSAGYEGSTQFVNIAALQAQGPPGSTPVENDAILKGAYQFGPESVQQGEFTLIFAQNQQGQPVVLKRIWDGDPNGMPIPVRQRIAALDQVRHPRLVALNGMMAAPSGAWVELQRPAGRRLTDVIAQNGPAPIDQVRAWIGQIAEILDFIHAKAFVYANLTTDAVWVQDDGSIIMEPFDVLTYEQRGNLGGFGGPELDVHPDQRQLGPATDVYSLAAVALASLAGLPLNPSAIASFEPAVQEAMSVGMNPDMGARLPDVRSFVATLNGQGGGKRRAKSPATATAHGKPQRSKVKIAIPVIFVLGVVGLAVAYVLKPAPQPPPPVDDLALNATNGGIPTAMTGGAADPIAPSGDGGVIEAPSADGGVEPAADGDAGAGEGDPPPADISVEVDPRLEIRASMAISPPDEVDNDPSPGELEEAAEFRAQAKALIEPDELAKLAKSEQRERYAQAMGKLARAVRVSGTMTPADKELAKDLSKVEYVVDIKRDFFDRLDDSFKEERISRVKQVYPQLAAVDAEATETKFFVKNKAVDIKTIEPVKVEGAE